MEKLENLEDLLKQLKERYTLIKREKEALQVEFEELKGRVGELEAERDKIRNKVESLLGSFRG